MSKTKQEIYRDDQVCTYENPPRKLACSMCSAPKPELESHTPGSLGVMGLTKVVVRIVRKKNKISRVMRMIRTVKMIMRRRVSTH